MKKKTGKVTGKSAATKKTAHRAAGKPKRKSPTPKKMTEGAPKPISESKPSEWTLRLYIAGDTPKSLAAQRNLKRICDKHLPEGCTIEVVDLIEHPELASADQVLAIPTLVRKIPVPIKRIIGDLSNEERAMLALDLRTI